MEIVCTGYKFVKLRKSTDEELHDPPPLFKYYFLNYLYLKDILHTVLCQLDISISFQEPLLTREYAA